MRHLALLLAQAEDSSVSWWTQTWEDVLEFCESPFWRLVGALALLTFAFWFLTPSRHKPRRVVGGVLAVLGLALMWSLIGSIKPLVALAGFWMLAGLTLFSATATISSRSPVYSAIWFAVTLLGTAGLFLLEGAQFLSVATVAVYAGAIVVTFLFVLMLAQPEGNTFYDRVSWSAPPQFLKAIMGMFAPRLEGLARLSLPVLCSSFVGAMIAGLVVFQVSRISSGETEELRTAVVAAWDATAGTEGDAPPIQDVRLTNGGSMVSIKVDADADWEVPVAMLQQFRANLVSDVSDLEAANVEVNTFDTLHPQHVARLGSHLFGRHLIAVQVAGTLLLVALVGAVVMASQTPRTAAEDAG